MKPAAIIWCVILAGVVAFLTLPATNSIFTAASRSAPYLMGFFKFLLLSSMGELLAYRIRNRRWAWTRGFIPKAIVWGVIGVLITFMFTFYNSAVIGAQDAGVLAGKSGGVLTAFFTSLIMNLTFGPAFMIAHRLSDTWIELIIDMRQAGSRVRIGLKSILAAVNWGGFLRIIILSVLLFWTPVHTLVFLLPSVYRIIGAALLSIALGVILALANQKKKPAGGE